MNEMPNAPLPAKQQLAAVRERRGKTPADQQERAKEHNRAQRAILAAIASEPKTTPRIAEETGLDARLVFWLIAGLRKYNKVEAVKKRGDYMTYRMKAEA